MSTNSTFTPKLWALAKDLLPKEKNEELQQVIKNWPTSYDALLHLDQSLGGPGFHNINCGTSGRYHVDDRDIFRPLQYFGDFFSGAAKKEETWVWRTRATVHMGGLQLESLVKRIAGINRLPLGSLLARPVAVMLINKTDQQRMQQFSKVYNAAKHDIDQPKDTHLFTIEDVILTYFVVRKLSANLYPLVKLKTDLTIFDKDCM